MFDKGHKLDFEGGYASALQPLLLLRTTETVQIIIIKTKKTLQRSGLELLVYSPDGNPINK